MVGIRGAKSHVVLVEEIIGERKGVACGASVAVGIDGELEEGRFTADREAFILLPK